MTKTAVAPKVVPIGSPALRVQTIRTYAEFLGLEPAWDHLVHGGERHHPFLEFGWARTWWDCFSADSELNIIVIWDGDEAIAIVPMMLTTIRMMGLPVKRLGFFYNSHVPRTDFLMSRRRAEAYRAIWDHLASFADWDLVQLCQLPAESQTLAEMAKAAQRNGNPIGVWASSESPYVSLDQSALMYQESLPTKHRANLRNRLKRLKAAGSVRVETVADEPGIRTAVEDGFKLEAAAWKGAEGTAIACSAALRRFYHEFAHHAAQRGWLRLNFLRAADQRVAFDYSLEYNGHLFLLKQGYDPSYSQYSPSNLLLSMELEEACGREGGRFDFLGDFAEWKRCWARESTAHSWLYIFSKRPKARLLHYLKFVVAPIAKRIKGTR